MTYRDLKKTELVQQGDEFLGRTGKWEPSINIGGGQSPEYQYRRPIETMKKNTPQEQIDLIKARMEGKTIQMNSLSNSPGEAGWIPMPKESEFSFGILTYRVAKLVLWVNVYQDGYHRAHATEKSARYGSDPCATRVAVRMVEG